MKQPKKHLTEVINFRVPSDLAEAMREAAARDDRTLSNWVRTHIKTHVEGRERRRRASEVTA